MPSVSQDVRSSPRLAAAGLPGPSLAWKPCPDASRASGLKAVSREQAEALDALSAIGDGDAAAAVTRLISEGVVQGPNLSIAMVAAATLRCRLPARIACALLQHADPATRAAAACCAPEHPATVPLMVALLDDLHPSVAAAAVRTLGRWGHTEARPALLRLLDETRRQN